MKSFLGWLHEAKMAPAKNEEEAFHQAILKSPRDALPWLVYADWLEERNDWRGELARLVGHLFQNPNDAALELIIQFLARRGWSRAATHGREDHLRALRTALLDRVGQTFPVFVQAVNKNPAVKKLFAPRLSAAALPDQLSGWVSSVPYRWQVERESRNDIVLLNAYQLFDHTGTVAGAIRFTLTIPRLNPLNFEIELNDEDYQEIADRYENERTEDDSEEYGIMSPDGIHEHLTADIHYALDRLLRTNRR